MRGEALPVFGVLQSRARGSGLAAGQELCPTDGSGPGVTSAAPDVPRVPAGAGQSCLC